MAISGDRSRNRPVRTGLCAVLLTASAVLGATVHEAADLNPVTLRPAPTHAPVVLVRGGQPLGQIVRHADDRMTRAAVQDLQRFVLAGTGAQLPVVDQRGPGPAVVVGDCPDAGAAGLTSGAMPVAGFGIKTAPDTVFIVGNGPGTTWGVDEFLERFVGVRWYWPEERGSADLLGTSIKESTDLVVPPTSLTDAPVFRKRHRWPSGGVTIGNADMVAHDRRLRSYDSWPTKLIVHAPHGWAELYQEPRPQIFQLRNDGGRDFGMLCYGHPLTLQTYLEEIDLQLTSRAAPDGKPLSRGRRIIDGNAVTVSPGDMSVSCRCEHCRALWDDEGGIYSTASRVLATFVAKLAREVRTRWPALRVIFLPYKNYTYAPRGVSFPDNVEIQICGMPGLAQYKDRAVNAAEQANIDAWVLLSGRKIQNWHYSCWPADRTKAAYLFPHTIQAHYRANRDKTVGSFINGVGNHWPRQHLSLYVWLKVLWCPEFDVDAAIAEYCRRMYGPAVGPMRELVGMLIAGWEEREWSDHTFSPKAVHEESYPRRDVERMEELLAGARELAAGDELVTKRLAYYSAPLEAFFAESKQYVEGTGLKALVVVQAAEDPVVDGALDEPSWSSAQPVSFVRARDREQSQPSYPTTLRAVWTRRGVTFGFHMVEPEPGSLKRDIGPGSRDAALMWWNDNVEIFLDVAGRRSGYYQFIVNANGAFFDGKGTDTSWDAQGVKAAATLGADSWSMEVFIPFATFEDALAPGTGVQWYGNFTRHRVTDGTAREYQRLNTTFAGPSNDQNAFGPIRFVEQ